MKYRIDDRTGGGESTEITADTLEDALSQAREWIEDGDWTGNDDGTNGGERGVIAVCRTIELPVTVTEINAGGIDGESHDTAGEYTDPEPDCPVDEGWDFVNTQTAGMDDFGCRGYSGTALMVMEVCHNTGIYRDTYYPGVNRNPGEPTKIVTYRERDEASEKYILAYHDEDGCAPKWLADYLGY